MPIEFKVIGVEKIEKAAFNFLRARQAIQARALKIANDFGNDALKSVTEDYLSGPRPGKLGVRTGRLRSSIRFAVDQGVSTTSVKFGSDVPYARIHEEGGTTSPHVIRPRRKPFLAFQKGGQWIFTTKPIQHPGSVIPKRPFLRPGLEDNIPKLRERLRGMLTDVATGGGLVQ